MKMVAVTEANYSVQAHAYRSEPNKRRCIMRVFFVAILLILAIQAHATTLVYKSFDDLVKEADGIVMGTVTNIRSNMKKPGPIYTYVTLGDLKILFGRYDRKEFTLRMEGGRVGNKRLDVEGSPVFRPKEKVIVFAQGNGRNIVPLVGWGQGVFRIRKDRELTREVVVDSDGNRVFAIQDGHLIKEQRVPSEEAIVGGPVRVNRTGKPAEGSFQEAQKGETVKPLEDKIGIEGKKPMILKDFLDEIQKRATQRKTAPTALVSVGVGDKIEVPKGVDARPQGVTESSTPKQATSVKKSPGQSPEPIDIEAEKKEAEKKEAEKPD